jgi:hypothetical protein
MVPREIFMMLDNSTYNKIKLIHEISRLVWFIDKHALVDANNAGDKEWMNTLIGLRKELEKQIEKCHKSVCLISQ